MSRNKSHHPAARVKARRNRKQNAFAIASAKNDDASVIPAKRRGAISQSDGEDGGSDSEGNQWKIGQVDPDDDSEIDSDEAMGESDEERFEGFVFRGSSSAKPRKQKKSKEGGDNAMDLNEDESGEDADSDENREGFIDLSEMLDRSTPESTPESSDEDDITDGPRQNVADYGTVSDTNGSDNEGSAGPELLSSEDEEEEDPLKLKALESLITSLPTSDRPAKRARLEDSNESKTPDQYNLSLPSSSKKLTVNDLLASVADPTLRKSLKPLVDNHLSGSKTLGKLSVPLAKRHQDRLDRAAAYAQTKETLKRWVDTVKHNREAEHLHFPLANATNAPTSLPKKLVPINPSEAKPMNSFENTISGILKKSNMASEKSLQEFEELATQKLSVEEAERRTAELRMARELMYREEVKAKRLKKIKSKSYRRIKKRERQRQLQAIDDAIDEEQGGADPEAEEELLRKRAEERMSLRHKQSRWAKGLKESGRGAWDAGVRSEAVEMANRHEELRKRIEGKAIGSDEQDEGSGSDDPFDEDDGHRQQILRELEAYEADAQSLGPHPKLMAMKFMKDADAAKRRQNESMIKDLRDELEASEDGAQSGHGSGSGSDGEEQGMSSGRMFFRPEKKTGTRHKELRKRAEPEANDEDEGHAEGDEEVRITNNASTTMYGENPFSMPESATQMPGSTKPRNEDSQPANPWLPQGEKTNVGQRKAKPLILGKQESKKARVSHKLSKDRQSAMQAARPETERDGNVVIDPNATFLPSCDTALEDNHAINLIPAEGKKAKSQRELIKRAFAGDNVVREFQAEKKEIIKEDDDQVIDETLPGWGHWDGAGLSKFQKRTNARRKKRLRTVEGVKKDQRKDSGLDKVIINEKRDKKAAKFQVPHVPHPFESKAQYERSLRLPIGQEWTTKNAFQNATKPRVIVKQGRVVEPLAAPFR